jgi:hypothetical protein
VLNAAINFETPCTGVLDLMLDVEFALRERHVAVVYAALHRGLATLGCDFQTARLLPPLDVTDREIELTAVLFGTAIVDVVCRRLPREGLWRIWKLLGYEQASDFGPSP